MLRFVLGSKFLVISEVKNTTIPQIEILFLDPNLNVKGNLNYIIQSDTILTSYLGDEGGRRRRRKRVRRRSRRRRKSGTVLIFYLGGE